jgi:hypothetical protein
MLFDVVNVVTEALPQWNNGRMGEANWLFFNGPTHPASTVAINVDYVRDGTSYEIVLAVYPLPGK